MSIGIAIVTHPGIGSAILATARSICPRINAQVCAVEIAPDADLDQSLQRARDAVTQVDSGDGVLLLTDLIGATPHNTASSLAGETICVVSGLNLPMLLRALNYADVQLAELAERAKNGGRRGINGEASG